MLKEVGEYQDWLFLQSGLDNETFLHGFEIEFLSFRLAKITCV